MPASPVLTASIRLDKKIKIRSAFSLADLTFYLFFQKFDAVLVTRMGAHELRNIVFAGQLHAFPELGRLTGIKASLGHELEPDYVGFRLAFARKWFGYHKVYEQLVHEKGWIQAQ